MSADVHPRDRRTDPCEDGRWRRGAVVLLMTAAVLRIAYLIWACPYTLIEDEAHYWEWSRRLEWSYYTKGPGVAWVIAGVTRVLGEEEWAIRAPAVLASFIMGLAVAGLAADISGRWRVGFLAAVACLLPPILQATGLMMTIDGPYSACWAVAMWAGWRALGRGTPSYLILVGAALGIGVLFKYTALLALPGLVWYAWKTRGGRPASAKWWWMSAALFAAAVSPIAAWNTANDWPTFRHLLGHLGMQGGDVYVPRTPPKEWMSLRWMPEYIGAQAALWGPVLALALAQGWAATRGRTCAARRSAEVYLLSGAAPTLLVYLIVSLFTRPEGNWPLAGYLTLLPLAAWRVADNPTRFTKHWWRASIVMGVITALSLAGLDRVAKLPGIGRFVPLHRFMGADVLAQHTHELAESLRAETGREPFILAMHYGRASQLAYYLPGRPTVYCSSSLMLGGRPVQYDYWEETDLRRALQLRGRPAILFGATLEDWAAVFQRVEQVGLLRAEGKSDRPAFRGYGFLGFPRGGIPFDPGSRTSRRVRE